MVARSAGGFTLVEVLVALFVLSVGIVGAAATQAKAAAARQQSALMQAATRMAASLAERMRANPVVMSAADASNPYLHLDYDTGSAPPTPAAPCYGDDLCSPSALAAFDLYETTRALREGFPQARVRVCRDGSPWNAPAGSLSWDCAATAGAPVVIKIGWRGRGDEGRPPAPSVALVAGGSW